MLWRAAMALRSLRRTLLLKAPVGRPAFDVESIPRLGLGHQFNEDNCNRQPFIFLNLIPFNKNRK
jgi:hypothetical protein